MGFEEPGFTASSAVCYVLENILLAQNSQLIMWPNVRRTLCLNAEGFFPTLSNFAISVFLVISR